MTFDDVYSEKPLISFRPSLVPWILSHLGYCLGLIYYHLMHILLHVHTIVCVCFNLILSFILEINFISYLRSFVHLYGVKHIVKTIIKKSSIKFESKNNIIYISVSKMVHQHTMGLNPTSPTIHGHYLRY